MQFIKKIVISILKLESRIIIAKYKPFVVAVTGSVGKTSTKDAIYSVIKNSSKFARKSDKSFNSEIGLPLTVIGVPNAWKDISGWVKNVLHGLELIIWRSEYPDCLVLEIGADHPGDIQSVTKWLHPDIVVMTKVSSTPVHVEFFASPDDVFKEKSYLAKAVKAGGTLVLLADDEKIMTLKKDSQAKVVSYGMTETADVKGLNPIISYGNMAPTGIEFTLSLDAAEIPVKVNGVLGNTYIYPLIAAAAVGKARGMTADDISKGMADYVAPRGRMNIISGITGSTIVDDTYNSSPDAAISALDSIGLVQCTGRKIAVLGDMMELGKYASDEHRRVGSRVATAVNILVTVGPRSRLSLVEGAVGAGMSPENIFSFDSSVEAGKYVASIVGVNDIILVKGSQSMRMERVSAALLRESSRAAELLVRQEKEWLEKR